MLESNIIISLTTLIKINKITKNPHINAFILFHFCILAFAVDVHFFSVALLTNQTFTNV